MFLSSNPCTEDFFKIRNSLLNQAWSCKGKLRPAWSVTLGHCEKPAWVSSISEEMFFTSELHNLMNLLFYFFYFAFVVNSLFASESKLLYTLSGGCAMH